MLLVSEVDDDDDVDDASEDGCNNDDKPTPFRPVVNSGNGMVMVVVSVLFVVGLRKVMMLKGDVDGESESMVVPVAVVMVSVPVMVPVAAVVMVSMPVIIPVATVWLTVKNGGGGTVGGTKAGISTVIVLLSITMVVWMV